MSSEKVSRLPRLIVVAESPRQRLAFGEAVKSCGYELIDCVPSSRVDASYLSLLPDMWLIDSDDDIDVIERLTHQDKYLLGFTPAPEITNIKAYAKWQRHLKRKLIQVLGEPANTMIDDVQDVSFDWQYVFVLGASMGGPRAVKAFLDNLPSDLPLTLILAQHNDAKAIHSLPTILTRNNMWQSEVVTAASVPMRQGHLLIVPPDKQVKLTLSGVELLEREWGGQYKPSISDVMHNASQVFGHRVVHIIFSGMGDDGSSAADFVVQQGSKVWVQNQLSCECDSQPDAMIQTGRAEFVGDPAQLAQRVIQHVTLVPAVH